MYKPTAAELNQLGLHLFGMADDIVKKVVTDKKSMERLLRILPDMEFDLIKLIRQEIVCNSKFELLDFFEFTVPTDFDYDKHVEMVSSLTSGLFGAHRIDDPFLYHASDQLVPGKTYIANIFRGAKNLPYEEIVEFMKRQGAIFAGARGLALALNFGRKHFPIQEKVVSFIDLEKTDTYDKLYFPCADFGNISGNVVFDSVSPLNYSWAEGFSFLCINESE